MFRIEDLAIFVRTAALGSFSDAAREAGILPSQVSIAIKRLESALSVCLFIRSTRSVRLTTEGMVWLPYARQILDSIDTGLQKIQTPHEEISGLLKINAPSDLGRSVLLPVLDKLCSLYPSLRIQLLLSDKLIDIFKEPVDVAFRYGVIQNPSYVALPVAPDNRRVLVASPKWVAQNGIIKHPSDLSMAKTLSLYLNGHINERWIFKKNKDIFNVHVNCFASSDDGEVIKRMAINGNGIAYKSWLDVFNDVKTGKLQQLLPDYEGEHFPLHMICPSRYALSNKARLLYMAVREECDRLISSINS